MILEATSLVLTTHLLCWQTCVRLQAIGRRKAEEASTVEFSWALLLEADNLLFKIACLPIYGIARIFREERDSKYDEEYDSKVGSGNLHVLSLSTSTQYCQLTTFRLRWRWRCSLGAIKPINR